MKIKECIDLQKLKDFGFEFISGVNGYYKVYFPKLFGLIPLPRNRKVRGIAIYEDRNIIIKENYGFSWIPAKDSTFAIQDLIDAGFVEGV